MHRGKNIWEEASEPQKLYVITLRYQKKTKTQGSLRALPYNTRLSCLWEEQNDDPMKPGGACVNVQATRRRWNGPRIPDLVRNKAQIFNGQ